MSRPNIELSIHATDPQTGADVGCSAEESFQALVAGFRKVWPKLSRDKQSQYMETMVEFFAPVLAKAAAARTAEAAPAAPPAVDPNDPIYCKVTIKCEIDGAEIVTAESYSNLRALNRRRRELGLTYIVSERDVYDDDGLPYQ